MTAVDEFGQLLTRLTPGSAKNEACVKFLLHHEEDLDRLFTKLLEEMSRSSLNGRMKQLNFLEYCTGIVGNIMAPPKWNQMVACNVQRVVDHTVPTHLVPQSLVNIMPANRFVTGLFTVGLLDRAAFDKISAHIVSKRRNLQSLAQSRPGKSQLTKEEVLRRMEDDRERSKKYRESELAMVIGSKEEFERMWETEPPMTDADLISLRSINAQAGLE